MKAIILTSLLLTSLLLCSQFSNAQCHLADWSALKALYESTDGDNWANNTGWQIVTLDVPPIDCDLNSLYGVTSDNICNLVDDDVCFDTGVVVAIDLSNNNLNGSIPAEINYLQFLTELGLNENQLNGEIPTQMGDALQNLEKLELNQNQLTGTIPESFVNLINLNRLNLSDNNLSGCYPDRFVNLCYQLGSFALNSPSNVSDGNSFDANWRDFCITGIGSCPIPQSICRQTDSLALIKIYQSLKPDNTWNLTYPVSHWPGVKLINENACIDKLDLSEDGLWGVIPPEIGDLSEITFLRMVENEITGSMPSEIGNLTSLKVLSLSDNNMTGPVPKSLSNLTNLKGLYLSQNQFTEVPFDIGNFSNLVNLYLFQNELDGCYPTEFIQLCDQLVSNSSTNFAISSGNNFDASWVDFCQTNAGACLQSPTTVSTNYSGNVNNTVTLDENGAYVIRNNDVQVKDYMDCDLADIENCPPVTGFDNLAANEVLWAIEKGTQFFEDLYEISLPQVTALVNSNYNDRPNSSTYSPSKNVIYYGIGDGIQRTSMTAPDIVGHEFMHFVIKNLNDDFCVYGECGALNESFADIFGEVLEYILRGSNDWVYGNEVLVAANSGVRSLSNPKSANMQNQLPDTYLGDFWVAQESTCIVDLCGIHTNNGVHNYWFYLLANGGTGTNDNGFNYNIQGIGIEKAAQIAFTNLFNNLTPAATYTDAMYGSINVAKELYGENSNEVLQTLNAWEAVGLTVLQSNPINWRITDFGINGPVVGNEIPIQFDLSIDSLEQDISADGLSFTLQLPENYLFEIDHIYAPLSIEEVFITELDEGISISINRQNAGAQKRQSVAQKVKSGEPILRVGGDVVSIDVDGDCVYFPPIEISGSSQVANNQIINFNPSTLLFGSDCNPNQALKRQNSRIDDNPLNVALQLIHQSCLNLGALKVEVLNNTESSAMPYHYYLFDQSGEVISSELESFNLKHQFYNLEEGIYQLLVEDSENRNFIKNFEVNFSAKMNGSTCCPENLTIPPGEFTGFFNASNRIRIKSGTSINIGQMEICD